MRQLKKFILNLFGIEAILPKGTAYITFMNGGIIHLDASGPNIIGNLNMRNCDFDYGNKTGCVTIKPKVKDNG